MHPRLLQDSAERHPDVLPEPRARADALIPAFDVCQRRPIKLAIETVPAARVSAEYQIGEREFIALEKVSPLQLPVDDPPQACQDAGVGFQASGVSLGGARS